MFLFHFQSVVIQEMTIPQRKTEISGMDLPRIQHGTIKLAHLSHSVLQQNLLVLLS